MTDDSGLPSTWTHAPLGDIVNVLDARRVPVSAEERASRVGPYPYYGANGQAGVIDDFIFDGDYVLLAEDGGHFDSRTRGVAYRATGRFWVNNHAHILEGRGSISPAFLTHALNSIDWMPYVSGSTRLKLTQGMMAKAIVPLPPLAEQERIAKKIETLREQSHSAREALDAVPPLLDKLRQSILAAAFRGDLTADWRAKNPDVEPAAQLLARIRTERRARWESAELARLTAKGKPPTDDRWKDNYAPPAEAVVEDRAELPAGWCWASVDEVSDLQLGQQRAPVHADAEVTYPYVRAANITWDGIDLTDVKRMGFPDPERYMLAPGDVLLSEASGSPTEVGKPVIWRGEIPNCCYQKTLLRARPSCALVTSEWLHLSFLADALLFRFARMAPGVGILHLTAERMRSWPVPVAPSAEQQAIVSRARTSLDRAKDLSANVATTTAMCAELEAAILAKAFRGELVAQDPNDEPASVLLERIRASRADAPAPRRGRPPRTDDAPAPSSPAPRAPRPHAPAALPPALAAAEAGPTYQPRATSTAAPLAAADLVDHLARALWRRGPLDKDDAIRAVADHLRAAGRVDFQRLRADGPLYTQLAAALDLAVKAGHLDRPRRGAVRACRPDPADYTPDDWRAALLAVLTPTPTDQDAALRAAADWARDTCGLAFERLRSDGHILTALRAALTSALRAKLITRPAPSHLALAPDSPTDRQTTLFPE